MTEELSDAERAAMRLDDALAGRGTPSPNPFTEGRCRVTLKVGMSLDGRIATRTGESRWITGDEARRDAHRLRAGCDAVMVGSGTARSDDPMLNVRGVEVERPPLRVVIDGGLTLPATSQLARTARELPVLVFAGEGAPAERRVALEALGVEVVVLPRGDGGPGDAARVDLRAVMRDLARRGVVSLLCEGGGGLHGALLDAGLADRVVCYLAPMLLGGSGAVPAFGGSGVERLVDATRLGPFVVARCGADLRLEAEVLRDVHRDHSGGR